MTRKLLVAALIACGLPLAAAGPAAAESIVFIKDRNLWVAGPDGSAARAITTDGTESTPYWSPSQADDGTIAVAHRQGVELWNRDGTKLAELDPPALTDSVSHPVDGAVADAAISPDGRTIAFAYATYSCPVAADCTGRSTLGYMPASGTRAPDQYGGGTGVGNPSWVSNSRTLAFGGYNHQVNTHDLGPGTSDVHWFDDWQIVGQEKATDLGDGEMNAQGTKLALIRSYGENAAVTWYATNGAPPAIPTMVCSGKAAGIGSPTWAPDGDRLAWHEPDGVWTIAATTTDEARCADVQPKLTIPGASEPDWGPAGVGAPKPPPVIIRDEVPNKQPEDGGMDAGVQELVTVETPRKPRAKGFSITVTPYAAGGITATVKAGGKTVLKGSATAKAAGPVKVKLKRVRKLRKASKAKLTVVFTAPGKRPETIVKAIRLSR